MTRKRITEAEAMASLKQRLHEAAAGSDVSLEAISAFFDSIKKIADDALDYMRKLPSRILNTLRNWYNRVAKRDKQAINEGLGGLLKTAFTGIIKIIMTGLQQATMGSLALGVLTAIADAFRSGGGGPCMFLECGPDFFYFFGILWKTCMTILNGIVSSFTGVPDISIMYDGAFLTVTGGIASAPYSTTILSMIVLVILAACLLRYFGLQVQWNGGFIEMVYNWAMYKDRDDSEEYADDDGYQYA